MITQIVMFKLKLSNYQGKYCHGNETTISMQVES